jgi:hypothetical protein
MVTSLEIHTRAPVLGGKAFGDAGAYEKIAGTLRFEIDPQHPLHRQITDIALAETNPDGRVAFSSDFYVLKPVDTSKSNRRLLLDIANRGRKVAVARFNSATQIADPTQPSDFGNGFLMRHGYTVAWVGWQADVPRRDGLLALEAPRAKGTVGTIRCELRPNSRVETLALADRYHIPNPTVDIADPGARLFVREHYGAQRSEVPRSDWRFSDPGHITIKNGFVPGFIYDAVYRSADPLIVGLGFLAVRDAAAWLRWAPASAGNPCADELERAYLFGQSQSGRFLRHLLFLGLDEDEHGRMVFDAVMPHVAGGRRGEFNLRLGQPSLNASESVGSLPPFDDAAAFAKLNARAHKPHIVATNTAAEYWRGDGSLIHTDAQGTRDDEPLGFVRKYLLAGAQHGAGALPPLEADANTGSKGYHMFNVVDYAPMLRAALVNLDRWVSDGVEPPASVFPRLADGTAVTHESLGAFFRSLPGVRFPERIERPSHLDFGPDVERGIAQYPPRTGAPYRTYASAIDADGNEVGGIRGPELRAPLATFTGWNPRDPQQGAPGDLMSMMGSTLPFPRTRAERERTRDPRVSIEERYSSRAAYIERVRTATRELIAARYVLSEDLEGIIERAGKRWDWIHSLP